jgi:hypothetical protein
VTTPGVYRSPGKPPLDDSAQAAIRAAQERLAAFTPRLPFPMPREEREEALKDAAQTACKFCGAWHEGASSPACPRIAKCKMNADGMILEVEFWPDGITTSAIETDGEGNVRAITYHKTDNWDTSRVVRVQDAAEEDGEEDDGAPDE